MKYLCLLLVAATLLCTPQAAFAQPSFETFTEADTTSGTTVNVALPAGTAQDDLLIAQFTSEGAAENFTTPAGWTLLDTVNSGFGTSAIYYKIAGAAEAGPYAFVGDLTNEKLASIYRYSSVDTSFPIQVNSSQTGSTVGDPAQFTVSSITSTLDNALLLRFVSTNDDTDGGTIDITVTDGHTARNSNEIAGATDQIGQALFELALPTAGASATGTFQGESLSGNEIDSFHAFNVVLQSDAAPGVAISSGESSPTNANPIPVTFTFTEDVTGFVVGDITVGNGSAGNFQVTSGSVYTADITPSGQGAVTVDVNAGVAQDGSAIDNTAATQFSITFDSVSPNVSITSGETDPTNANPIPVTFTFNQDVTGFTVGDITVGNGSAGNFQVTSATVYTADITPSGQGAVTVDVNSAVAQDAAGNDNNAATQFSITYDSVGPTVAITSGESDPTNADPIPVTFTFNQDVTGFVVGDITVGNGSAGNFQVTSGSVYTADITPTGDGAVTVDVNSAVAQDAAGNDNSAATQFSITSDTTDPTVTTTAPGDITELNETTFTISGTCSENTRTVNISVTDTGAGVANDSDTCTGNVWNVTMNVSGLADGAITITATHTDAAGNNDSAVTNIAKTVAAPTVIDLDATTTDGTYGPGATINLVATFSRAVTFDLIDTPTIALNSGGTAYFTRALTATTALFTYTVATGDSAADLDYSATNSLSADLGTIQATTGLDADLTLLAPGGAGSLGNNRDIVIGAVNNQITWDGGGGDTNWSTAANWAGDQVPTVGDTAVFDGTSAKAAVVDTDVQVAGINITAAYGGSIIVDNPLLIGTGGYTQAGGAAVLQSTLAIEGDLDLSGGSLLGSVGNPSTIKVVGAISQSGGTFNHIDGTLNLSPITNNTLDITSGINHLIHESTSEDSLVAHWKFDSTASTALFTDASGSGIHAAKVGTWSTNSSINSTEPYLNTHAYLPGAGSYAVADSAALDFGSGDFSVSAWVYPTNTGPDWQTIIGKVEPNLAGDGWWIGIDDDGEAAVMLERTVVATEPITPNIWSHIIVTRSGASVTIDVNGSTAASTITANYDADVVSELRIGGGDGTAFQSFNGRIDSIRVYSKALSGTEIANLQNGYYADGDSSTVTSTLDADQTISGNVSLYSGILDADSYTVSLAGDWVNRAGTSAFAAGTSTLSLTGSSQQILGSTDFNNVSKIGGGTSLTLQSNETQNIAGDLTLTGTISPASRITLDSTTGGVEALLIVNSGTGSHNLSAIDVTDIDSSTGLTMTCLTSAESCVDSGNNTNWTFSGVGYFLTANVIESGGAPMSGVTIDAGTDGTRITNGIGSAVFSGMQSGTEYTITPSLTGYTFSPTSATGTITSATLENFIGTINTYDICGTITDGVNPLIGVPVTDGGLGTVYTDTNGDYCFEDVTHGTNYTITASLTGYTFGPVSYTDTLIAAADHDFTGTLGVGLNVIQGTVTDYLAAPVAGIEIDGGTLGIQITDGAGSYTFPNAPGAFAYTITPSLTGYVFTPVAANGVVAGAVTTADFSVVPDIAAPTITSPANLDSVTVPSITVTGTTLANASVDVRLDGVNAANVTADGSGDWSVTLTLSDGLGNYTIDAQASLEGGVSPFTGVITISYTDECPSDPDKVLAGVCGCGVADTDSDGDTIADCEDKDDDNDGILDSIERADDSLELSDANIDTDGDGVYDYLDIDSDDDGIPDIVEAQSSSGYQDASGNDTDGDGVDNNFDGTNELDPIDSDSDGVPDYRDDDSDDDTVSDLIEGSDEDNNGQADYEFDEADSDGDGLDDAFDTNSSKNTSNSSSSRSTTPDSDDDGIPDYRDVDDDNDGVDTAIEQEISGPTKDTDGDGIPNYKENEGEDVDGDGVNDYDEVLLGSDPCDTDSDNDGILDGEETSAGTDGVTSSPTDSDSDDDGISDLDENSYGTDPSNADTDGDGLQDGTELGITVSTSNIFSVGVSDCIGVSYTGTDESVFVPDFDPFTQTDPLKEDSDGGGAKDGEEDSNQNGLQDEGERSISDATDDCPKSYCNFECTEVDQASSLKVLKKYSKSSTRLAKKILRLYKRATKEGYCKGRKKLRKVSVSTNNIKEELNARIALLPEIESTGCEGLDGCYEIDMSSAKADVNASMLDLYKSVNSAVKSKCLKRSPYGDKVTNLRKRVEFGVFSVAGTIDEYADSLLQCGTNVDKLLKRHKR